MIIHKTARILVLALTVFTTSAFAETYNYTGPNYDAGNVSAPYTAAMSITGSITTSGPIPASQTNLDISGLITAWSFSDGVNTISNANGTVNFSGLSGNPPTVSTDASSNITIWDIRSFSPSSVLATETFDFIWTISAIGDEGANNNLCTADDGANCTAITPSLENGNTTLEGTWALASGGAPALEATAVPAMPLGLLMLTALGLVAFGGRKLIG